MVADLIHCSVWYYLWVFRVDTIVRCHNKGAYPEAVHLWYKLNQASRRQNIFFYTFITKKYIRWRQPGFWKCKYKGELFYIMFSNYKLHESLMQIVFSIRDWHFLFSFLELLSALCTHSISLLQGLNTSKKIIWIII